MILENNRHEKGTMFRFKISLVINMGLKTFQISGVNGIYYNDNIRGN